MRVEAESTVRTQSTTIIARGKLPDDLTLNEYVDIAAAMDHLVYEALYNEPSPDVQYTLAATEGEQKVGRGSAEVTLVKAQYGSDLLLIISVATITQASLSVIAGTVLAFAKGLKMLADAGLVNERRLALKDKRIQRKEARKRAGRVLVGRETESEKLVATTYKEKGLDDRFGRVDPKAEARNTILAAQLRQELTPIVGKRPMTFYLALSELAEYGVEIDVSTD